MAGEIPGVLSVEVQSSGGVWRRLVGAGTLFLLRL